MPELVLLTHATEFDRPSNTGRLVLESATAIATEQQQTDSSQWQVRAVLWQRTQPDPALLHHLNASAAQQSQSYVLLYPTADAIVVDMDQADCITALDGAVPAGFILLDATWQQAQKMYNQSPYLHHLAKWQIKSAQPSVYQLRRNQKQQGWCTAELVQLLWNFSGARHGAGLLSQRFAEFNQRPL